MWLPTLVSTLFLAEAIWRFVDEGDTVEQRANAKFNGVNLVIFALLGLSCVSWPLISAKFQGQKDEKNVESEEKAKDEVVVVVERQDSLSVLKAARSIIHGGRRDDDKKAEVSSSPPADTPASPASADAPELPALSPAPAPAPKRQVTYLTNLKTFLTFIVVAHHTVCIFTVDAGGIQTNAVYGTLGKADFSYSNFYFGAHWFTGVNQMYFMAAFFLISAYFCPKSLDRKGFRVFVLDKIVRIGGGYLLYSAFLGPLLGLWIRAYLGEPLRYQYGPGTTWFLLWLLNFQLIYAALAQVLPSLRFNMPHPLVLVFAIGGVLCGLWAAMLYALNDGASPWMMFGEMNKWQYGIALYIPFFYAGIVGGRNNWLQSVEEMKKWVVWVLRAYVVAIMVTDLLSIISAGKGNHGIHISPKWSIVMPTYAVAMTLVMMQLFHQYFNATPQSKLMKHAGVAAYTVYIIQFWPMQLVMLTYVEILKAAGVPIVFEGWTFFTVNAAGQPAVLSEACMWGGWVFVFVVTQALVWPMGYYMRKLPVLNKML